MRLSGLSPDASLVEMIELPDHPHFVACQLHPELKSRPTRPHPLFAAFIAAAVTAKKKREEQGGTAAPATAPAASVPLAKAK
jgi:CTP synthase